MTDNTLQVINKIPIREVLDRLGIKYTVIGSNCLRLYEGDRLTGGRKAHLLSDHSYVHDFSGKGRASGESFAFVKNWLQISSKETFDRFEKNYNITNNNFQLRSKTYIKKEEKIKLRYHRNW